MGEVINAKLRFQNSGGNLRTGLFEGAVIDSGSQFEARRLLGKLDMDCDERRITHVTMNNATSDYHKLLLASSPSIGYALLKAYGDKAAEKRHTVDELANTDDINVPSGTDFGMYEKHRKDGGRNSVMYLPVGTIRALGGRYRSLYGRDQDLPKPVKLEATVTSAVWMNLGWWTIDMLDPRKINGANHDKVAVTALKELVGPSIYTIPEAVDEALDELKRGFAGHMAYAGLSHQLMLRKTGLTDNGYIGSLQKHNRGMYEDGLLDEVGASPTLDYMLAYPITSQKATDTINALTPVANAWMEQVKNSPDPDSA